MLSSVAQLRTLPRPLWISSFRFILDYSFFDQTTHWIRKKKNASVHWCGATQPKDRLQLNLWRFYASNEVFIIAWNISISRRNAEGLEPSNRSVEPQSAESQSEKQLHLSDTLKSDCILCERYGGEEGVIHYVCDRDILQHTQLRVPR